ncbi:MAG TPA: hypothetical protein VLM85_04715 [Polyangiaceae bacterium]|nr:hypothetical protein [Polyangiaceae bacterium]
MMLSHRLGFLFALALVAAACGGKIDDGTDSGVDSGTDSPSPPPVCKPTGSPCAVSVDCCAGAVCLNGYCGTTPPTCTPDYAKCSTSSQCCSQFCDPQTGFCEPSSPPPPPCQPDGTPCGSSSQCCSLVCNAGTCQPPPPPPPPCKPDGWSCISAGECCSSVCGGNVCGAIVVDGGPIVDSGPIACGSTSNKVCDQCVAKSCCPQMVSCGNDSTCSQWLGCVQSCEQKGNSAFWCMQYACGSPSTSAEAALYSALYTCAQQYCSTPCTTD